MLIFHYWALWLILVQMVTELFYLLRSRISEQLFPVKSLKDDYNLDSIVSASLTGTHNVNWKTWCVAKKFGVVESWSDL